MAAAAALGMWEDIFGGQAQVCWRCSTEQGKDMEREDPSQLAGFA